jgi:hypothetical protein
LIVFSLFPALQKCNFPGSPAHSAVTFSDESLANGAVASYSCERGFELLGPARRVCDNGSWTPEGIPFCGESSTRFVLNFSINHSGSGEEIS